MVSYQNSVRETERMVSGVGRASGVTAAQIGVYARAASDATGISTRSAREAGGEIASTGRVGGEMVAKLVGSLKDYAKTTGQETAAASQDLAKAFADPAKGADLLNERLGFLDDRTAQTIRRLQEQGDRVGAQRILFDAYSSGLSKAAEVTSAWGRVSEAVTSSVSDAWDRLGQHVDRVVTGGSLEDRIETARKVLAESEELQQSGIGRVAASVFGQDPARDRAALDALLRQQDERTQRAARASAAQNSREIGDMVRQLDPVGSAVSETQGRVERLRKAISDPLKFGLDPTQLAQTQSAFERLSVLARNTREDIEKFGDPAIAAANRQAESRNRLVTSEATPVERQIAELRDKYDADLRSRNIDPTATRESVAKPYNDRINDPNLDSRETSAIAAAREVALRAITEREGLTRTLNTEIDTIKKEAESRASRSQNVSSYMERAIGVESGGDPTAKNRMSTATGLGQFLEGTWIPLFKKVFPDRAAGMSDREILARRTDAGDSREVLRVFTEQNARFLEKQNVATTDRNLYLAHFAGAQGAADLLNADRGASAESILGRRAAVANPTIIGGGRTAGDVINYADRVINKNAPAVRASDREVASIRTQITLTDQTTEAEARRQKIQELLNDDLQRGRALGRTYATAQHLLKASASQLTPELEAQRKVFIETADAYGKAQSGLESSRLGRDIMFDRAQIDRSQSEQNVASRLRGTGLGMDSAEADALRLNDNLRQTRDLANGAFSGMLGDLRQGATAITVIGNATSRFTDKLLSAASDRAISALFAGSGKDGGGFLSGVANLFGSASLPKFAEGGVSNGPSIFGEAGPEAAVPLSRGRSIPVELRVPRVQPMAPANFNQPAVVFSPNIINQAPNTEIATREVPDGRGGKREEILIREAFVRGASTRQGQQAMNQPRVATR